MATSYTYPERIKQALTASPGASGNLALGAAVPKYKALAAAHDGASFESVTISEGSSWEVRTGGVYDHDTLTLTRGTLADSSTGSAIAFTAAAKLSIGPSGVSMAARQARLNALEGTQTLFYANLAAFPDTGSADHHYVAKDTGLVWWWNDTAYQAVGWNAGGTALLGPNGEIPLKPTGYDQTSELQQYFNDSVGGFLEADLGAGDFIITGDLTIYPRRVAEWEANYGYGLKLYGSGPNTTRLIDARATKTNPLLLITEPIGVDTGNRAQMCFIKNISLISANTSGTPNPLGTLSGVGLMAKASSGSGYGAYVFASSKLEGIIFHGYEYPLSLADTTQIEISHCRFDEFLTAIRMGGNADLWNINHCGFGSDAFGTNYRSSSVCIDNNWDSGTVPTGGANNFKAENCWSMKVGTFYRNSAPTISDSAIRFVGCYFEDVRRYYYADFTTLDTACRVVFDTCHFSHMNNNDFISAVKSNNEYGARIQFGSTGINTAASTGPTPYLTLKNCSGDGTPSNALVSFNNRTGRIKWDTNEIPANSTYGHVRCIRDGYESWRNLANSQTPAVGSWVLGDDQAAGLKIINGEPMLKSATIASGGTYNINHINGNIFELTLPDGNCTIDYAAYSGTPPSPLLAAGTEIDLILIVPATVTVARTITWGARMAMNAGTLNYSTTEQNKRCQIKLRAPKDSGNVLQLISRDPVFI